MNLLPSAVHVSSTIESGATRSYCVALFANSPFSLYSKTHEFIAQRCSCVLHLRVWSPEKLLCSAVRQLSILHFIQRPMKLLPSAVHVFSTFESGLVFHDCLSADPQGNPPDRKSVV